MALLAVLAACTLPDTSDGASTPSEDDLAFVEGETQETLRLAMVKPSTADPIWINAASQHEVLLTDLLYDGLVEVSGNPNQLNPSLALAWSEEDSIHWTFELDPTRVTAEHAKASFERLLSENPDSVAALGLGNVIGASAVRSGESPTAAGFLVQPNNQLEIKLQEPDAAFAWLLSGVAYSIVGPDQELTGRYRIAAEDRSHVRLESSSWTDVEIRWQENAIEAYQALTQGGADAAVVDPSLINGASARFGSSGSARNVLRFLALNERAPDLIDLETRQAVIAAIPRDEVTEDWDRPVFPTDGLVAPSMAGYRVGTCDSVCTFDPSAAAHTVDQIPLSPELTLTYVGERDSEIADRIAKNLRDAGFTIEVVQVTAEDLANSIANESAELFLSGWISPASSSDAVVRFLIGPGSQLNMTQTSDERVDELLTASRTLGDDQVRWALLSQAEEAALERAIIAPLSVERNLLVSIPDAPDYNVRADGSITFD